jgi:streptogramin lyase
MRSRSRVYFGTYAFVAASLAMACAANAAESTGANAYICDAFSVPASGVRGNAMATAAEDTVWLTDFNSNRLIRIDKNRRASAVVPVDGATRTLTALAIAPDGTVWYTKSADRIGRLPAKGGDGVEFELPKFTNPAALTYGPNGDLWFVSRTKHFVARFAPSGDLTTFDGPRVGGAPLGAGDMTFGPDGALWLTSSGHNAVYRFDLATQEFRRFDIAAPRAQPRDIIVGPDRSLWVALSGARKILRLTTAGATTEFDLGNVTPVGLASGPDKGVWISTSGGTLVRIDPTSAAMQRYACAIAPSAMTVGPDGRLWVLGNGRVAVVRERENAAKARVAAVASIAPPTADPTGPRGAQIEILPADLLADRVRGGTSPIVVQFSSPDPNCTHCIPANDRYDELARNVPQGTVMLRVYFDPWESVGRSVAAQMFGITGLPTVVRYQNGVEAARLKGDYATEQLAEQLQLK